MSGKCQMKAFYNHAGAVISKFIAIKFELTENRLFLIENYFVGICRFFCSTLFLLLFVVPAYVILANKYFITYGKVL